MLGIYIDPVVLENTKNNTGYFDECNKIAMKGDQFVKMMN